MDLAERHRLAARPGTDPVGRRHSPRRWAAALGVMCLLLAGCGSTRVPRSGGASVGTSVSAAATSSAGGTGAATTAPSATVPVAGRPGSLVHDMSGTSGAGFVSPSGNIACAIWTARSGLYDSTTTRCDVTAHGYRPPPKPRDCDTEYGQTLVLGAVPRFVCAGDTLVDYADLHGAGGQGYTAWFDPRTEPTVRGRLAGLGYGDSIRVGRVTCTSTRRGVRCRNTRTGAGFLLARDHYRLTR